VPLNVMRTSSWRAAWRHGLFGLFALLPMRLFAALHADVLTHPTRFTKVTRTDAPASLCRWRPCSGDSRSCARLLSCQARAEH
jgi:hypothetical protein